MSETLPAASAAKTPASAAPGAPVRNMLFPPHRVKRLLEEYTQSAGRSLGGPDDHMVSPLSYKLPPDVELSKTSSVVPASKEEDIDDLKKEKAEAAAAAAGPNPNGLVTLSRIDDVPASLYSRMSASAAADERAAQLLSAASDNRMHLTGDMIRKLREQHKQSSHHDRERHAARSRSLSDVGSAAPSASSSRTAVLTLPPVLCSRDRGHADVREAVLWGEPIAAFAVGGEMRLCLPRVMQTVLIDVLLPVIQAAFDELRMCVSMCSPEQLDALKRMDVLPVTAASCSLVTQSDAERLCAALLERQPPLASTIGFKAEVSPFSFKVQHECFARCVGLLLPEAATSASARCIKCLDCEGVFSPQRFVCHSHRDTAENRTCHWGFDSANWRAYLQVYEGYSEADREKHHKALNHFKAMFAPQKRKQRDESPSSHPSSGPHKKPRLSSEVSLEHMGPSVLPPPAGAIPVTVTASSSSQHQRTDPYSLYLYNTWAAAQAAAHKSHPVHPSQSAAQQAAAVAWTASVAAVFKEGKDMGGFPGFNGGSSFSRHPAAAASLVRHAPSPPSKSPPPNASLPYSYTSRSVSSPATKSSPSSSSHLESPAPPPVHSHPAAERGLVSPDMLGDRSSRSSRSGRSSLAEEITAIRSALDGASSSARERTLAILERIMARLAEMEADRDHAVRELMSWQKKYSSLEKEYMNKRQELRDLIGHPSSVAQSSSASVVVPPRNNGHGPHWSGGGLRGPPGAASATRAASSSSSEDMPIMSPPSNASSSRKRAFFASGATSLPKVEMKSPARIIEERESSGSSLAEAEPEIDPAALASHPAPPSSAANNEDSAKKISQRHRSGTPTSTKSSRDSEDLRDRMMTMEAELRALREELSGRKVSSKHKDNGNNGRPSVKPATKENGDSAHQ